MMPLIRARRQGPRQDSAEHFQHALNFCRFAMAAVVRASTRYKRDHFWLTLMVKARRRPRNALGSASVPSVTRVPLPMVQSG